MKLKRIRRENMARNRPADTWYWNIRKFLSDFFINKLYGNAIDTDGDVSITFPDTDIFSYIYERSAISTLPLEEAFAGDTYYLKESE